MRKAAIFGVAAALLWAPAAHAEAPWQQAEQVRSGLFTAQTDLLLGDGADASADVADAEAAVSGPLARGLDRDAPGSLRRLRAAIASAKRAASAGDEVALAAARGGAIAAIRDGAYRAAVETTLRGEIRNARDWLLIRDFRQATRFTRPGVDATVALESLEAGRISAAEAVTGVRKDLLDAYQARLITHLDDAAQAEERGFPAGFAENAAIAAGYWRILAAEYQAQRGAGAREAGDAAFVRLEATAAAGDSRGFRRARGRSLAALDGFTAAPFTPEEQARRAHQLTRFLELVPIEYDHGTDDGRVTIPFEIQEAIAFTEGARSALNDLEAPLMQRDPEAVAIAEAEFNRLEQINQEANEGIAVADLSEVEEAQQRASDVLDSAFPEEWKDTDAEADFDLIEISLDQMEAAVNAGERERAEQARLSAYAFYEFGPERLLNALDPQLVAEVEGLVWYGADGKEGLAKLIASDGSTRDLRETRVALDEKLERSKETVGEGASGVSVVTNAAMIVFREGLEAILIIAAITASLVGANRRLRQPVLRGALLALPASALLFVVSVLVLDSLSRYGEKLEAIVGLIAIAVLLLVLNWFFHRVYWTEWIAGHRRRGKALAGAAAGAGAAGATVLGLYLLGFSSVFREGFETVLFLQALQLEAGIGIVLAGVSLGLVATAAVGALTFALERRLPYKRMLILTGVLISLVLVVMVGNVMRTLQGVGWAPITPMELELPLWMGTWLGVFPTWETIGAQLGALAIVIGSYVLAEWVRRRNVAPGEPVGPDRVPAPAPNGHAPAAQIGDGARSVEPARNGDSRSAEREEDRVPVGER